MFELNPIKRSSNPAPQTPPDIEIRANNLFIQWRYKGFIKWNNIIQIKDLLGPRGPEGKRGSVGPQGERGPQGEKGDRGAIGPSGKDGEAGSRGEKGDTGPQGPKGDKGDQGLAGAAGNDGREIELRINDTHIQWRYIGDDEWQDLILLDELKGPKGDRGEDGEDGSTGPRGPQGPTGPAGPQGPAGGGVTGGDTLPPSGDYEFELFYKTDTGIMYIWDGDSWEVVGSGASGNTGYRLEEGPDYQDDYVYVGYEHESNGNWYIYRRTYATNARQYASGTTDFATNWTGRAGLTYA